MSLRGSHWRRIGSLGRTVDLQSLFAFGRRRLAQLALASVGAASGFALTVFTTAEVAAHPAHASTAEATWNVTTRSLEIALRVAPEDLARAVVVEGKAWDLEPSRAAEAALRAYVRDAIELHAANGTKAKLVWVGAELGIEEAWLYFELDLEAPLNGAVLTHRLFFEFEPTQLNVLRLRNGGVQQSLLFHANKPSRTIVSGNEE